MLELTLDEIKKIKSDDESLSLPFYINNKKYRLINFKVKLSNKALERMLNSGCSVSDLFYLERPKTLQEFEYRANKYGIKVIFIAEEVDYESS